MPIQLLDVVLLVENGGHVVVLDLLVGRLARYVIAVAQIQRKVDYALLAVEVLFLSQQTQSVLRVSYEDSRGSTQPSRRQGVRFLLATDLHAEVAIDHVETDE